MIKKEKCKYKFIIDNKDYLIDKNIEFDNQNIQSYNSSYFYGEANTIDIYKIIKTIIYTYLNNKNENENDIEEDNEGEFENKLHFIDIGSGTGKLILYLYENTLLNLYGIEIIEHRYDKSVKLLEEMINNKNIDKINYPDFVHNDFKNIYFGNYDIVYCCNLIFSKDDNELLFYKFKNEFQGYVLLFFYDDTIKNNLIKEFHINTSWCMNVSIFLFLF